MATAFDSEPIDAIGGNGSSHDSMNGQRAELDEKEMLVMELLGLGHRRRRRQADESLCCTCQQGPPGLDGTLAVHKNKNEW